MKEQENKIEIGKEYSMFRLIKGNRPIVKAKVKNLIKSYQDGLNLFPFCPILINNDNFVIDGQHRLAACKELRLPVYYMVVPNITLIQIALLNAVQSKWTQADFFNCFIENGNKDYQSLEFFKDKYSLPLNIAACLLQSGSAQNTGSFAETFRNGLFKVVQKEKAERILKHVFEYEELIEDKRNLRTKHFIYAIQLLMASEIYPHALVIEKLKKNGSKLQLKISHKEYIFHIEELFNKGNQKRYFIYQKPKDK